MLKALGWTLKIAMFAALVLVLGNYIHVGGRTVSDQVRTGLAHAERSDLASDVKDWATRLTKDARKGASRHAREAEIPSSEKQKLRDLIRELNSSRGHD